MSRRRTCATRFASSSTWRWPRPATNTTSTTGSWSSAQRSATRPEAGAAGTRANIDRGRGTEMYRVGISGSYGGLNLGDEAILQSIVTQLRRSLPVEITVFSRDVKDTLARHKVLSEIKGLDLLILGGGGILFDAEAAIYLREVALAEELDVPVLVYAVSAGPLQDPAAQALVRDCLNRAAAVTVRERRARQVLEEVGVRREIEVTADPAILLEPEPLPPDALKREGLDESRRLIGMSVREPGVAAPDLNERHYHALLANAADYMVDRLESDLVFVPMERRDRKSTRLNSSHVAISYAVFC